MNRCQTFSAVLLAAVCAAVCQPALCMTVGLRIAAWTPASCSVTFDANGGEGGTTRCVENGSAVGEFPLVTHDGYTLTGWFTAADDGSQVFETTVVTGDVTYYAHWQIRPGEIVETVAPYDGIYDGAGHGIEVAVTKPAGATVKYAYAASGPYTEDAILFTNVTEETVTVWYTVEATNYTTVTNSGTVKIAPKPLTEGMVESIGNHPYTGKAQTPKPTVTDVALGVTLREDVEYTLSYANNTAIGEGIVTVKGKGNYTGSIARAFVIEPSEGSELEERLGGAGKVESDGAGGWIVTLKNDVDSANLPIEIPDDLGPVTIDLNGHDLVGENGQDGGSPGESALPGGDGKPAIRIVPRSGDGEPTVLTVVTTGGDSLVKGGDGGAGNPGGNGAPAIEVADGVQDGVLINIGEGVTVQGGGVPAIDGTIGEDNGNLVKVEVPVPAIVSKEYTGGQLQADISATERYTVQNDGGVDAGNYPVTLTLTDATNYRWAGGDSNPLSLTFTIAKATYDMSGAAWDYTGPFTYDGTAKSVHVSGLPYGVSAACSGNTGTDANTYTAHATLSYDTTNYNVPSIADCNWTIAKKSIAGATMTLGPALVYTGSEQVQTVTGVKVDGLDATYTVSGNTATEAGTYTLTVTGTGNFTGVVTKHFDIGKAGNWWIREPSISGWASGRAPSAPDLGEAKFGSVVVTYGEFGTMPPVNPGDYTATFTVAEASNHAGLTKMLPFTITSAEEAKLDDAFDWLPATIEPDGEDGWIVTITNDIDSADLPIEVPDNVGSVTIDLGGHDLLGANGEDGGRGATALPGGNGLPAIRIVAGEGVGEPTVLTVVTTGGDATVKGGDGGAGNPGGNGAPAIEVADGAQDGVLINIGAGVTVQGGDGGYSETGRGGDGGTGVVGNVGTNDGTIVGGNGGASETGDGGNGGAGVDGNVDENNGVVLPYALTEGMVGVIADQSFTGEAIMPEPSVYDDGRNKVLVKDVDYTLSYVDNVNAGTATATVTGMGVYKGTVTRNFRVMKAVNTWIREPSIAEWSFGMAPSEPELGEAKFGTASVSYSGAGGLLGATCPNDPGEYVATFVVLGTDNYTELTKSVSFRIIAVAPPSFRITFNANGGSGVMSDQLFEFDKPSVLDANAFTRFGWEFVGWATRADGEVVYADGQQMTVMSEQTLYAQWTEVIAGRFSAGFAKAQTVLGALYGRDGVPVGTVQVKAGKINKKKGTVKITATATLLVDGKAKKVAAKAVDVAATSAAAPVNIAFKAPIGEMAFELEADGTFTLKNASYVMAEKKVGGNWTRAGARVYVAATSATAPAAAGTAAPHTALPQGTIEELLPDGEPVIPKAGKWSFAKAAGVKWAKPKKGAGRPEIFDEKSGKGLIVDAAKGKTNLSGLKLTYTPKTGIFTGSFKIYAIQGGKLKKVTVKVAGVVVDGKGWGSASGPGGVSFAVTVE